MVPLGWKVARGGGWRKRPSPGPSTRSAQPPTRRMKPSVSPLLGRVPLPKLAMSRNKPPITTLSPGPVATAVTAIVALP